MNKKESYTILGLDDNASIEEIKNAYRKLAKQYHPDKTGGDEFLANMFKKINTAYNNLISSANSEFYQNNSNSYSSNHSQQKGVFLNPDIEKWIENHHKISKYIHTCKNQLAYTNNKTLKKNLSFANIAKLLGITLLIIVFFFPYQSENVIIQPKSIEEPTWQTITTAKLFKVPNIQTTPITTLPKAHQVDSLNATKYFLKVNVATQHGIQTGYILKDKLKK